MNFNEAMSAAKAGNRVKRSRFIPETFYMFKDGAFYCTSGTLPAYRQLVESVRVADAMAEDWEVYMPPQTTEEKVAMYDELKSLLKDVNLCDLNVRCIGCHSVCVSCTNRMNCGEFAQVRRLLAKIKES